MRHCDLLMHVGDSKKFVCHCLLDILCAGHSVVLAKLGCSRFWRILLHVLLGSLGIQYPMFLYIHLLDPVASVAGIN